MGAVSRGSRIRNLIKASLGYMLPQNAYDGLKNWEFRVRHLLGLYYEEEVEALPQLVVPGDTVLDVGANIGQYSIAFSRLVGATGEVCSFEPLPHVRRYLEANVRFFRAYNLRVYPYAVSDHSGVATLFTPISSRRAIYQESALVPGGPANLQATVPVVTIDSIGLRRCDFLKSDTEGAELFVLLGAANTLERYRPHVLVEVNAASCYRYDYPPQAIFDFLTGYGYQCFRYGASRFWRASRNDLESMGGNLFFLSPSRKEVRSDRVAAILS